MNPATDPAFAVFRKGLLFAWLPAVIVLFPTLVSFVRSISPDKTTGLGAVAGGLSQALTTFGILAFVVCEVYGLILLLRTLSRVSSTARVLGVLSAGVASLAVTFIMLFIWISVRFWAAR
jgi:hypothetical protein